MTQVSGGGGGSWESPTGSTGPRRVKKRASQHADTQGPCLHVFFIFIIELSCKLGFDFVVCHYVRE